EERDPQLGLELLDPLAERSRGQRDGTRRGAKIQELGRCDEAPERLDRRQHWANEPIMWGEALAMTVKDPSLKAGDPVSGTRLLDAEGEKRPDAPPTSRLGRLARLTALAPRALPVALEGLKRARGVKRTAEEEREAREKVLKSAKKTAEAMLKTLGDMKGLPLKLGQMASYIDGLAPPGYEERFKKVLATLQAKAPPLSRKAAMGVVTEELGAAPSEIYDEWEAEPFAAASIGQVHRATTRGGDMVAVKVQYPGIDKAIENDLKSLSMLETMIAPVGRRYQSKETLEDIKSVFLAELDYTREAMNQDRFR